MMLPSWLNYNFAEQQAAILTRGLNNGEVSWGQLIATAETILSYYQEIHSSDANVLYNQELAAPLIAAARILDGASQPTTDIPPEHKLKLGLSAAVAFGMHGNFSSAVAVLHRFMDQPEIDQFSNSLLGTLFPSYIVKLIPVTEDFVERRYLELLEGFLETGDQLNLEEIRNLFIKNLLKSRSDLESSLFRSARLCLEHIFNLSSARVINEYCPLIGKEVIFNLVTAGIVVLLPPQYKAIVENSIFSNRNNLLIALPTSTGKTLLSELCLIDSLQEKRGIAVYITPYVALGSQVVRKLESHLPEGFRVHRLIAGIHREEEIEPELYNEVIVATPERFDLLIAESPWILDYLRAIVFDEAHIIESGARGIKVEGIISRLRLQQLRGRHFRIVLLSAVLDSYTTLKSWLQLPDKNLITNSWKPTARRIAIWEDRGYLTWYVGNEEIRQGGQNNNSVIGKMLIPWPFNDIYPTNDRYKKPIFQEDAYANIAYLVDYLLGAYGGSVMCVCATKAGTRRMAAALRERFDALEPVPPTLLSAISRINSRYKFLMPLADLLRRGIAFHNSIVPPDIRNLIEEAANNHELRAIAATSTLSEGVDLPFRFTILVDWLQWNGARYEPMSSLFFKNVSGRCGRATEFTEGDTIIFDNPIGDLKFTDGKRRKDIQHKIFLLQEEKELHSSIEGITGTGSTKRLNSILAGQFMSAIHENPDADDLVNSFHDSLLFGHKKEVSDAPSKLLKTVRSYLLDTEPAFAVAASPIHLTELGQAANRTGFSPHSCRLLLKYLNELQENPNIIDITIDLLTQFGTLPEQPNDNLKKILGDSFTTFCVRQSDFGFIIRHWLLGIPRERIFAGLSSIVKLRRKPPLESWLKGLSGPSPWDDEYDRFIDFIKHVLEGYLPWLMWASSILGEFGNEVAKEIPWKSWARMTEKGVDSMWAVNAIEAGCPGRRSIIAQVGRNWPQEYQSETDLLGLTFILQEDSRRFIQALFDGFFERTDMLDMITTNDIYAIQDWLWGRAGVYLTPRM